jgi:hypothetical protein
LDIWRSGFLSGHHDHMANSTIDSCNFLKGINTIQHSNFQKKNMASPNDIFLTNTNYLQRKSHMEDLLRSKGLYQIAFGRELEPTDDEKNQMGK